MTLDVLDETTLARLGRIEVWVSLYWDEPYNTLTESKLEVRPTQENLEQLREGRWLKRSDSNVPMRICHRSNENQDANLVCTLFPNGTDFRPAIDPDKNIFCYLVSRLWSIDPCINVFPSIHVYNSVGVHIAICHSEELKKHPMIVRASGVLMVLICLATMFLKQHSVIDVVGALLMASVIYPIAYAPEAEKKKKYETSF